MSGNAYFGGTTGCGVSDPRQELPYPLGTALYQGNTGKFHLAEQVSKHGFFFFFFFISNKPNSYLQIFFFFPLSFLPLSRKLSGIPTTTTKVCSLNSGHGVSIRAPLGLGLGGSFRQIGFHQHSRVSAVSGGGKNGGSAGNGGNSGGGGGGSGDEGGDNKWSFLSWYLAALGNHPVLTKALTSAILTFIGDLICQLLIDKAPILDVKRTLLFTLLGFILVGPTLHFWYLSLSNMVTTPGATGAFLRLVLDQFLFSPLFIGFFLSSLLTLEGRPSQILPKLQQEWLATVLANWQLWIPFQFLNFLFVPQQFQVLAANVIALAWNVILSFKAHKEILAK